MCEFIISTIADMLKVLAWPICVTILVVVGLKKLPVLVGAIQYKRLALLSDIKDYVYFLTDIIRREQFDNKPLTDEGYKNIYDKLISNKAYDLSKFINNYKAYCIALKDLKLNKLNKKAKTKEQQHLVVDNYINDVNTLIRTVMADEYFRSREDLQFLSTQLINLVPTILK
jgi:hypothetical protein